MNKEGLVIGGIVAAMVALLVFAARAEMEWKKWAASHCKEIGEISGSVGVGTGFTANGNFATVTTYTPGKTGYRCDDGKEYWR